MNILLVDDQETVIQGLLKGIDWKKLGFQEVFTAFCAGEAKKILLQEQVDILLCDIEMPGENGIQLLQWIHSRNIRLSCLFLTAHAEFDYAVDAMKMGSVDYILQPAPYREVEEAVRKAAAKLLQDQEKEHYYHYGRMAYQDRDEVRAAFLANAVRGRLDPARYRENAAYLGLPSLETRGAFCLLQILKWKTDIGKWNRKILAFSLDNVISEVFAEKNYRIVLSPMEEYTFAIFLFPAGTEAYRVETARERLERAEVCLRQYLKITAAFYLSEEGTLPGAAEVCRKLLEQKKNNIALLEGVYTQDGKKAEPRTANVAYTAYTDRWMKSLEEGYYEPVQDEILRFIDEAAENEKLGRNFLIQFHSSYLDAFLELLKRSHLDKNQLFGVQETDLYTEATQSLEGLRRFVKYTIGALAAARGDADGSESQKNLILRVKKYVNDNIEEDMRRSDVAEFVHLNEDYLTRVFRRETGLSLKEYMIREKMLAARSMIRTTNLPISFVAARFGYCNYSHFSKAYKKEFGLAPAEERKNTSENDNPRSE